MLKAFYEKCGVKVLEPSLETQEPKRQITLMRCKHCIKYALGDVQISGKFNFTRCFTIIFIRLNLIAKIVK